MAAVEDENDIFLPAKVRERDALAVLGFECEIWSRRADCDPFEIDGREIEAVLWSERLMFLGHETRRHETKEQSCM